MYYNARMRKIKPPSVAGSFYSADSEELKQQIKDFESTINDTPIVSSRAVIVPHAGLVYSGRLAYEGINQLDKEIKNLFIFAPAHRVGFDGLALTSFDAWMTPLGEIDINQDINKELKEKFNADFYDEALEKEHSIEIQVPIIQSVFEDVKIVPILVGTESPDIIEKIISHYYPDVKNGFIISSDLSHFLSYEQAKKVDSLTAQMIETLDTKDFDSHQACGMTGILGLVEFAKSRDFSLIRIDMTNSASVTKDTKNVVGYGSWFLYEGVKNEFLKKYYSKFIIDLCKMSIKARFEENETGVSYPKVLDESGASFVTLEKDGDLRGCIGSIIAHRSLIGDLISNSQNAAFFDPRFNPVTKDEIDSLQIAVSLLSDPVPIEFSDEADLLFKIRPFKDGIIIKDANRQAVYLPSVWEQLPDKKEFLNSLKIKAGLRPDYFSKTFEAYRFEAVYIK